MAVKRRRRRPYPIGTLTRAGASLARSAVKLGETALASGSVIGHRVDLAMQAAYDPPTAELAEFARMGTEKIEAMAEVGGGLWSHWLWLGRTMNTMAAEQTLGLARAASEMAAARDPLALISAQQRWALASLDLANLYGARMSKLAGDVSHSMLEPMHRRATANARRLAKPKV